MSTASSQFGLALANQRVVVTGAASGIGRAVAQRFAAMGSKVCLADINEGAIVELASQLGPLCSATPVDLADRQSCVDLLADAAEKMGGVDVLVNAGAIILRQEFEQISPTDIHRLVDVNMAGPIYITQAAASAMKKNRSGGRIILLSSQGAHTGGYVGSTLYAMTKAAVVSLVKSLARELAPYNINVNSIAPGVVDTPMIRNDVSQEALDAFMKMVPLGRIAQPREIADCCLFLASDWASYVTGHTLDVNGGQLMR
jgi:3-oxoacyl-[acyl-carrier protein] reductase